MSNPMNINRLGVLGLLFLLGLAAFCNSFNNAFLMDDFPMLVGNIAIGSTNFLQLDPSAKSQVYFRPVTHFWNLITFSLFGQNPAGYHCVNLLLFVAAGFALYILIEKVFSNRWVAFCAAALFVIHPINGVCVNYKNATGDPFFVLSLSLALLHSWNAAKNKSLNENVLSMIWLVLALLSHEIAFAFPLYLAALLYASGQFSLKQLVRACIPSTIIILFYLIFRMQFASLKTTVAGQSLAVAASLTNYFADVGQIIFWHLSKLVFTKDIVLMWSVPSPGNAAWVWAAALVFFVGTIIGATIYLRKRNPSAALGSMWFGIGFVPVLFACFSRPWFGIIVQPFWLVMSSFGFLLLIMSLFGKLQRAANIFLIAFLFCLMIPVSWRYNYLWADPIRYCEYWMRISPGNFFPQFWLAYSLMDAKEYGRAKEILENLLRQGVRYEWTFGNLGIAQYHLGNYKKAEAAFKDALSFNPYRGDTFYHLGKVYLAEGNLADARAAFEKAIALAPEIVDAKEQLRGIDQKIDN